MTLPMAAIVGRPNVGKSSLLNALCGRRVSIVDPTPGVTRDRISVDVEHGGSRFELVDTGGIGLDKSNEFAPEVNGQIAIALETAAAIVFVVDTRAGIAPLDFEAADMIRKSGKPVILAANKADDASLDTSALEFARLGIGDPVPVSAAQLRNTRTILDLLAGILGPSSGEGETRPVMKIAIVGRRNAGKSTLVNAMAGSDRVITSEIPGTTRDAVDIRFERGGKTFVAIDTAGLRRKSSLEDSVEFYSRVRAEESIRRCDVALLVIDATEKVGRVDKQAADYIVEHHRGCVIVINKWDLVPDGIGPEKFVDYIYRALAPIRYAPISMISAKTGRNVGGTIDLALDIFGQMTTRVPTAELNRVVEAAQAAKQPPRMKGKQPKMYFATQTSVNPPTIVVFTNYPAFIKADYRRFLLGRLRKGLPFKEIPVKMVFRMRA